MGKKLDNEGAPQNRTLPWMVWPSCCNHIWSTPGRTVLGISFQLVTLGQAQGLLETLHLTLGQEHLCNLWLGIRKSGMTISGCCIMTFIKKSKRFVLHQCQTLYKALVSIILHPSLACVGVCSRFCESFLQLAI